MNKRTRTALAQAHQAAQDATLDTEIHAAALPLRVTPQDLHHFDSQQLDTPTLTPKQAHRLSVLLASVSSQPKSAPTQSTPTFGELIRTARESSGLTTPHLARRLHIHTSYLSGLESNTRSPLALGPDGARRLVTLLNLPPHLAANALRTSMQTALTPTPSFAARMRRGIPRKERLKILEQALPKTPDPNQAQAWQTLIAAVASLEDLTDQTDETH